jgi:hypothetical protein|tara:strand:- start:479 stop:1087 length:609 start_codon:yes stop_codon:yes gene_type:complete
MNRLLSLSFTTRRSVTQIITLSGIAMYSYKTPPAFTQHASLPITAPRTTAATTLSKERRIITLDDGITTYIEATWNQRIVAHIYNGLVTLATQLLLSFLLPIQSSTFFLMGLVLYNGVIEQTFTSWLSENGQNLGMALNRIKLIRYDGKDVDLKTMTLWWGGHILLPINFALGFISPSFGLDNTLSGTVVVESNRTGVNNDK